MTKPITEAGRKMLERYRQAEANGELIDGWMRLYAGSGADKACAAKLQRDGHGEMKWYTSPVHKGLRLFRPTAI